MTVRFTERHMDGDESHDHIAKLKWVSDETSELGENTRAQLVAWIRDDGGKGYVKDSLGNKVNVQVVDASPPYLRTVADGELTDNLLSLPTY
jgi:hypothetical protein